MGTHVPCSAQRGLRAFPSALENPEAVSSQTQRGRCAIPSPGIPPPFPRVGSRDALLASKGAQRCLQPAGLSQHGAAAQHRVSSTRFIAKAPEFSRHCNGCVCVCVCVCECVSDPTAGQNGSAPEEPLLVPMLLGRHLQCPEGSELDSQVLQHCCARTLPWQQSKGGAHNPHPPTVRAGAFS